MSDRIVQRIEELFPGSTHVKSVGLSQAEDVAVWDWAKQHEFTIVSKDTDFRQMAIVFGHPPRFIWLRVGNCPTSLITNLLRSRHELFADSSTARRRACLSSIGNSRTVAQAIGSYLWRTLERWDSENSI